MLYKLENDCLAVEVNDLGAGAHAGDGPRGRL